MREFSSASGSWPDGVCGKEIGGVVFSGMKARLRESSEAGFDGRR